ncbi:protein c17orf39 homolog [Lichtheimia corymbifera JMRC:FSU:9682]|uniref:Protein c17orf39 homolog n=1 Tax=Lichtheimia corymbifera JMRC:FSU:9682 TaxID=1263082 RepID=A0A068S668_9FUNG|nr:protein c17orf39 homolog [Lichtheimia corymbifera JMRC:FSU:9682]
MPIPSASTSSSTTPTSTFSEPHQISPAAKPSSSTTPGCSECSADASQCKHKPGLAFPTSTTIDEKRAKCDRHSTSRSQASPSSMLLTSRKEGDVWVDISNERLPNSRLGSLYPGSCFKGMQHCGTTSYEVSVDIQHVDLKESTLCGYLNITGLTSDYPELTTFFQAEIIGPKYSFLTRKWQADKNIDASHWKRFPSFEKYAENFNDDGFSYDPYDEDFVYMRWKEHFLVPDHRVNNIDGASFAGFYYICYQRSTDEIKGYYFFRQHREWYQELSLKHVDDRTFGNFEMR